MRARIFAAAAALVAMAGPAAAAVLVVRSSGPSARSYPPGKALADSQTLNLKAKDMVTLLDSRGTRTLRGPGSFGATAAPARAATSSLVAITAQNRTRVARVGAVRDPRSIKDNARNIWQADVTRGGPFCIAQPSDLSLYRDEDKGPASVTVRNLAGQAAGEASFAAGSRVAKWPQDVPVAPGARYSLKLGDKPAAVIHLKSIAPAAGGIESLAQALIRQSCQSQLDVLIDTVAAPSVG